MIEGLKVNRRRSALAVVLAVTLLMGTAINPTTDTQGANGGPGGPRALLSLRVSTSATMDGVADEAFWAEAVELVVTLKGGSNPGDVSLKSVYNDEDIFFYSEWEDPTMSLTRGEGAWMYNPIPEDTMRSFRTSSAPVIDGDVSDKVWDTALPISVHLEFGTNPGFITLRSLHNDTHVFIQTQWHDPTFNVPRNSWAMNGGGTGDWEAIDGLEDMVNLMWDMDTVGFENVGCQVKCHIGKEVSYLDNPGDIADIWHMRSGGSTAALESRQVGTPTISNYEATAGEFHIVGYSDDTKVEYDVNSGDTGVGGRFGDEGSAAFTRNANATDGSPMYIETAPSDWTDAMFLYQFEIDEGETVVADPEDASYVQSQVSDAWSAYDALGATVPENILGTPSGSRADIDQAGIWKDGLWTVEMARPLVTGNDDDVQFDDLMATYDFGVSTMNNTAGRGHNYHTRPLHLDFQTDFVNGESGSEDRIAFLWEITPVESFLSAGCFVKCHPKYDEAGAFFENEGELGDLWHMKSARALPVTSAEQVGTPSIDEEHQATDGRFEFLGFMDDRFLTHDEEPHIGEGGQHPDEGESTSTNNSNPDGTKPLYIESDPTDYIDAMVLTQTEIDDGEALEIAEAPATMVAAAAALYEGFGALIPEQILLQPSGSRADMEQAAVWEDGVWHVEIRRPLVTGYDDDVQFDDLFKTYLFSIVVMDNGRGDRHSAPGTEVFGLSLYTPPTSYDIDVGPIVGSNGKPVEGADVLLDRNGTLVLSGVTGFNGTFNITIPPEWTESTVTVTVSKKGYQNVTFEAAIAVDGEFFPIAGTYPSFLKKGEEVEDERDTPGPSFMMAFLVLSLTGLIGLYNRRGQSKRN
jgi:hypothetical protein